MEKGDISGMPEPINGPLLATNKVVWLKPADKKKWEEKFLLHCCKGFMEIQANADKPFDPTAGEKCSDQEKEKLLEHCVYMWDAKQADKFLEGLKIKAAGLTGKKLMDDNDRMEKLSPDDNDKAFEALEQEYVKFQVAMVEYANK